MNIFTKTTKNLLKLALIATIFMLSPFVTAMAETNSPVTNIPDNSMYKYYALENTLARFDPDDEAENIIGDAAIPQTESGFSSVANEKSELDQLIQKQSVSLTNIESAMSKIENQAKVKSLLVGKSLGDLRFQLVQMRDHEAALKRMAEKTLLGQVKNDAEEEVTLSEEVGAKADNFLSKQEGKFSLLGWFVGIL
jgi:hypothetical protein